MENKNDKTQMYSDENKTSIYGDKEKRTKESAHQIKAGDQVLLKNKEYTIIELVSESTGEAAIYKAKDSNKQIIALKLYYEFHDPEQEPNTEALERIKKINDPDILKLIDYGTGSNKFKGKYCFEILDFAYGLDLLCVDDLKQKYTTSFLEKEVIPQIFKGILKLHENKIYHCDLKPQNVFYLDAEQKEIVVGDYGSAKTFDYDSEKSSRKTTTVKGTDFYLPPEQARGFISEKNDYYSFGMILLHVFYPDEILSDDKKSLSRVKLKQIIERQFESKPIIDYDPKFKRINHLIEGLTLADFNLRWGEKEVKDWLGGKTVVVSYRRKEVRTDNDTYAERSLKFGRYSIQSIYDVRDYIIKEKDWYANLIEDEANRDEFTNWFLELYDGDRSKRSAFNRIVKDYSQDGIEFVGDAITRFFIPDHPVTVGAKLFKLGESNDIIKSTGEVFSHLLFDCWDGSRDEQIKRHVFNFEFALRYTKDDSGAQRLLKILYKVLSVKEVNYVDFEDYTVHAYKYINSASKDKIKEFLTDILASDIGIEAVSLDKDLKFKYHVLKTASSFFKEIGSKHTLSLKFKEVHQIQLSKVKAYTDLDDFINKQFTDLFTKFTKNHRLSDDAVQNSKEQIKETFIKFYTGLYDKIESELKVFQKKQTINSFEIKDSQFQVNKDRIVPAKLDYHKIPEICDNLISYKEKFKKIEEIKTAVKKDNEFFRKSSQLQDILNKIEEFSFTGNFDELDITYNDLHRKRTFKISELTNLTDSTEHKSIPFSSVEGSEQINVERIIDTIAISGNGERIVVASRFMCLRVIDTNSMMVIRTIGNLKFVTESLSVCQEGRFVACTGIHDKEILIYNLDTGKRNSVLKRGGSHYKSAVFSPDNKYLAVSSYEDTVLRRYKSWTTLKIYECNTPVCFHPMEDYMANTDYPNTIQLINLHNDERWFISEQLENDIDELCFNPWGSLIASHGGDHLVNIWDVRKAELIQSLRGHAQNSETYICFSPNGKAIASLMNSGDIRLWNPNTGQAILTLEGFYSVKGICFHPSGEYIFIADGSQVNMIPLKNKRVYNKTMCFADYVADKLKPVETEEKKTQNKMIP